MTAKDFRKLIHVTETAPDEKGRVRLRASVAFKVSTRVNVNNSSALKLSRKKFLEAAKQLLVSRLVIHAFPSATPEQMAAARVLAKVLSKPSMKKELAAFELLIKDGFPSYPFDW